VFAQAPIASHGPARPVRKRAITNGASSAAAVIIHPWVSRLATGWRIGMATSGTSMPKRSCPQKNGVHRCVLTSTVSSESAC
jgi:hypothetical protein